MSPMKITTSTPQVKPFDLLFLPRAPHKTTRTSPYRTERLQQASAHEPERVELCRPHHDAKPQRPPIRGDPAAGPLPRHAYLDCVGDNRLARLQRVAFHGVPLLVLQLDQQPAAPATVHIQLERLAVELQRRCHKLSARERRIHRDETVPPQDRPEQTGVPTVGRLIIVPPSLARIVDPHLGLGKHGPDIDHHHATRWPPIQPPADERLPVSLTRPYDPVTAREEPDIHRGREKSDASQW